ncbi:MAG: DUF1929 domain-containing protein, partial [Planctomycetota bacterium]|nr:DUF1929 domain-containing protein [Planctomycetota bacterium]
MVPRLAAALSLSAVLLASPASAQVEVLRFEADAFGPVVTWRDSDEGWYATAAHATLMSDGRILFIGYARPTPEALHGEETKLYSWTMTPTPIDQRVPSEMPATNLPVPYEHQGTVVFPEIISDNLFCSGHTLTADGDFFSAGGTRVFVDLTSLYFHSTGLPYATKFDGTTWTRFADEMKVVPLSGIPSRWYPTATRLTDGRIMVMGGYDQVYPVPVHNTSAEIFDVGIDKWEIHSSYGEAPMEIQNPNFTHAFLLPEPVDGYDLIVFGGPGLPVFARISGSPKWDVSEKPRPGTLPFLWPNYGASTALMPIRIQDGEWGYSNGSVLVTGGAHGTQKMRQADIFDPVADTWLPTIEMKIMRHDPSTVLLPDGRILVLAGHDDLTQDPGVRRAQYIDPTNDFGVVWGRAQESFVRGYHTVSLLLPDGRVLLGGGRDHSTEYTGEKTHFRYYYPAYMRAERPEIIDAPASFSHGETFQITTADEAPAEIVLMALGSMTHAIDMNQRYVQLATAGSQPGAR